MKLFQIEEPDGAPGEGSGPGLAIGIALERGAARVAASLGGNAELLRNQDGADRIEGQDLAGVLLGARGHAEKALSRPVTHAVVIAPAAQRDAILAAGREAGLIVTRVVDSAAARQASPAGDALLGAALLAEEDATRA
jgi:hypothetical protein